MLRLNKNETEKKEYFFALEIDVDRVKSAIWTIDGDQSKLMSLGETVYWEKETELLECVDNSLSSSIEKLSSQEEIKEPEKVIFGLSSDWIEQNKILSEKIEILKKISQKMGLSPLGFMIVPEAIIHWLKKIEGVPLNAILVSLSQKKITVSLVEQGKVIQTNLVVRSESLGADLAEGLSRINHEMPFPARILLYDHEEKLEEARQELINWPWTEEKVNFLHLPKVEILATDFDIKAIVLASASQMAEIKGLQEVQTRENLSANITSQYQNQTKKEEKPKEELPSGSIFGFVKNQDITELENKTPFNQEVEEKGFIVEEENERPELGEPQEFIKEEKPNFKTDKKNNFNFNFFKNIPAFLKAIHWPVFSANRNISSNKSNRSLTFLFLAIGILVFLMVCLGFLYWNLPQASITLFVEPEILEKDFEVKLDPSLSLPDKDNLILPGIKVETEIDGSKETITTGTKLIGEKAKGKVIIYNRTDKEKTLLAGAEITGPNNLKFTLNDKITIASESSGSDYIKVPGKTEVGVTAIAIGSDGNLASGSEFSVSNLAKADFVAKNEASFSEGTSREIQVVDKKDQEKLLAELQKELEEKAIENLNSKVTSGEKLVDASLTTQIDEKTFSKKVGDEANSLSLALKIKAEALSFSEEEFKQLAEEQIKNLIPDGFNYNSDKTEMSFKLKESSEKDIFVFNAHFKANLSPQLDLETIKKNLLGKKPAIGEIYLDNLAHVDSFTAEINPRLPEGIATFPRVLKRITIEVESK